jgi:hypothetical protein
MDDPHWEFQDMQDGEGLEPWTAHETPCTTHGVLWALAIEALVIVVALVVWRILG